MPAKCRRMPPLRSLPFLISPSFLITVTASSNSCRDNRYPHAGRATVNMFER